MDLKKKRKPMADAMAKTRRSMEEAYAARNSSTRKTNVAPSIGSDYKKKPAPNIGPGKPAPRSANRTAMRGAANPEYAKNRGGVRARSEGVRARSEGVARGALTGAGAMGKPMAKSAPRKGNPMTVSASTGAKPGVWRGPHTGGAAKATKIGTHIPGSAKMMKMKKTKKEY